MTQVILFTQDIQDLELLKSSLTVPYSTVDAGAVAIDIADAADADQSKLIQASDALPLIQSMDLSDTNTVGILYENTHGLIHNLSDLVGGLVEKSSTIKMIDLLTCNLNSPSEIAEIKELEATHGVQIRYSIDLTGHEDSMGNWLLESHGVEVKDMYFNEMIDEWKHVLHAQSWAFNEDNFLDVVATATDTKGEFTPLPGGARIPQNGRTYWSNHYITTVTFKPDITTIGDRAFYACTSLTSIVIPDGVKTIGYQAYMYSSGLKSIIIPDSVTSIGAQAFSYVP